MAFISITHPEAHTTMYRQFNYEFDWVPEHNYIPGTEIEIRANRLRSLLGWRYTKFYVETGDVTWRWKLYPTPQEFFHNRDRAIARAVLPYGARKGRALRMRLTMIPPFWAGANIVLSLWMRDMSQYIDPNEPKPLATAEEQSTIPIEVKAGPVERFAVYARPASDNDGEVRVALVPEDRFGNASRFGKVIPVRLHWNGEECVKEVDGLTLVKLEAASEATAPFVSIPLHQLGPDQRISNGVLNNGMYAVSGNTVLPEAIDGRVPLFGEFHWHTDVSGDAQRPIREALASARDHMNMDFAAPGDHNPSKEGWEETVEALEEFDDDEFTTFFGWEAGSPRGHENYYFTKPDSRMVYSSGGVPHDHVSTHVSLLNEVSKEEKVLAIPHHTNSVAETRRETDDTPYWHQYCWSEPSVAHRLVEIFQGRGNQERNDYQDMWQGWHQNNGASVQDALAMGYRVGFTGSTDNHAGLPGRAFAEHEGMGTNVPKSVILTGAWSSGRDREHVFDALYERHTWAVWNTRAIVHFTVNQALGGSEIKLPVDEELTARIRLWTEAAIQTVEIVSEGEVVWQDSIDETEVDVEVALGKLSKPTHFYLRGLLRDGGIFYASPVFIGS